MEAVTCVAAGVRVLSALRIPLFMSAFQRTCWFTGSVDAEVRQYSRGKTELEGLVTSAIGVPIRSIAVDPKGSRVAVASEYVRNLCLYSALKLNERNVQRDFH